MENDPFFKEKRIQRECRVKRTFARWGKGTPALRGGRPLPNQRMALQAAAVILAFSCGIAISATSAQQRAHLGFDRNIYPGDDSLPVLRKSFEFVGYWLGPPPGEKENTWLGKRDLLKDQGFGFLLLFSGPESSKLKDADDAKRKGMLDAQSAAKFARQERFPAGAVIFLDIEEGGRLPDTYHDYLRAWTDELTSDGYSPGVYCSAIPVSEGKHITITTAKDIQDHLGSRRMTFWVYNDVCPPAPGCVDSPLPGDPAKSGFATAAVWQYAQSPRRKEYTTKCKARYAADGNCYAPGDIAHKWFLDVNVASSSDPSGGR
jgi:hypothetical protein